MRVAAASLLLLSVLALSANAATLRGRSSMSLEARTGAAQPTAPPAVIEKVIWEQDDGGNSRAVKIEGTIQAEPNTVYTLTYDVMRGDLASHSERVNSVVVNGNKLSGCNPKGSDYACDFVKCAADDYEVKSDANGEFKIEMNYQGHSMDCTCDQTTDPKNWQCKSERVKPLGNRIPTKAAMKFTLTPKNEPGKLSSATADAIKAHALEAKAEEKKSEAQEAAMRGERTSGFGKLKKLIVKLQNFVASERVRVDNDHAADINNAEQTRDGEIQAHDDARKARIAELAAFVEGKKQLLESAQQSFDVAVDVHDDKVTKHNQAQASLKEAQALRVRALSEAEKNRDAHQAGCARNVERSTRAGEAQLEKDQKYLEDALGFIDEVRGKLGAFQDKKASVVDVDASTCKDAKCPKKLCPDGDAPRQVGSDCCSCEDVGTGRASVERSNEDITKQQDASNDDVAEAVDDNTGHRVSENKALLASQAASDAATKEAEAEYLSEKDFKYALNRIEEKLQDANQQATQPGKYKTFTDGTCASHGYDVIETHDECRKVTKEHPMVEENHRFYTHNVFGSSYPDGCYYKPKQKEVYLGKDHGKCTKIRVCICKAKAAAATSLLSISETVRLTNLLATHVNDDPRYLEDTRLSLRAGDVAVLEQALQQGEDVIREEQKSVKAKHAEEIILIHKEKGECDDAAQEDYEAAVSAHNDMEEAAKKHEGKTSDARKTANDAMEKARGALERAQKAYDDALVEEEKGTNEANEMYQRGRTASLNKFKEAKSGFDGKEQAAYTYLDGEDKLLLEIENALVAAGKITADLLIQLGSFSKRMVQHVSHRVGHSSKYVNSLEGQSGVKQKILDMLNGIEESLKAELAASAAEYKDGLASADALYTTTTNAAKNVRDTKLRELQEAVDAAQVAKDRAKETLAEKQGEFDDASQAKALSEATLKAREEDEAQGKIDAAETLKSEKDAASNTRTNNLKIVGDKQTQAQHYLDEEMQTVDRIGALLQNLGKDYKFQLPATSAAAAPAVVEKVIWEKDDGGNSRAVKIEGTIQAVPNTVYTLTYDVMRGDLASHSERVNSVVVNGKALSGCNPKGSDYACDFVKCAPNDVEVKSDANGEFKIEMNYQGHSMDCTCDQTTDPKNWQCKGELVKPWGIRIPTKAAMKFTLTPVAAASTMLLAVTETRGQKKMSVEQREAVSTLLSLLGKHGSSYTGSERTFGGSDHSSKTATIEGILDEVRGAIRQSKAEVDQTFEADSKQVQGEWQTETDNAQKKHDDEVARLEKRVKLAKDDLAEKTTTFLAAEKVLQTAQRDFDDKSATLTDRLDAQRIEGAFARSTYTADEATASAYKRYRKNAVQAERDSDLKYIGEEQDAIDEIRDALNDINFALLMEEATKYDYERKSYMKTDSSSLKEKMLDLLGGIRLNVKNELKRVDREFAEDMKANKLEKARADDEAQAFHDQDLRDLEKAVTDARAEFESSNSAYDAANKAHSLAADRHQEDRDDLETAQGIEATNEVTFEEEYQRSKASAGKVYSEVMEILDNQKGRGDFYLKTSADGLKSIHSMLKNLDITTTDTRDVPNRKAYAGRTDYVIALTDARFAGRTEAERARITSASNDAAIRSVTKESTNGDKILYSSFKGQTGRETTKASAASKNYDVRDVYDNRGNIVGAKDTISADNYLDQALLETGGGQSPFQVGTFIGALSDATAEEEGKSQSEYDEEAAKAADTRDGTVNQAKAERDRNLKIDDDRTAAAQAAYDDTYVKLSEAKSKKKAASDRHATAAATLNDALKTQEHNKPLVEQGLEDAKKFNQDTFAAANKDVTSKKDEGTTYLNEELSMIAEIEKLVERKLAIKPPQFLQMVSKLMHRHTARLGARKHARKYKFDQRQSDRFADKQDESGDDYMTNGTVEANDYGGHTKNIQAMLDSNAKRINKEIGDVAKNHEEDMKYLEDKRTRELTAAITKRDAVVTEQQGLVDDAKKEAAAASSARATQQKTRDNNRESLDAAQGALDAAMGDQKSDMVIQTSAKSKKDDATLAHFNKWMLHYDDEEARATKILARERQLLADIAKICGAVPPAEAGVAVNKCTAEQEAYDSAMDEKNAAEAKCSQSKINTKAYGSVLDYTACDQAEAAGDMVSEARDNKDACLDGTASELVEKIVKQVDPFLAKYQTFTDGTCASHGYDVIETHDECRKVTKEHPMVEENHRFYTHNVFGSDYPEGCYYKPKQKHVFLGKDHGECTNVRVCICKKKDTTAALIELQRLSEKYLDADTLNAKKNAGSAMVQQVIDKLDAQIQQEMEAVAAAVKGDREDETKDRDDKYDAAQTTWQNAKDAHAENVKGKTGARDETKAAWESEYAKWKTLQDAQDEKDEASRAALNTYVAEKRLAESRKIEEDFAAETRFSTEEGKVDDIKSKDTNYLNKELTAIAELKDLVAQLNSKGL